MVLTPSGNNLFNNARLHVDVASAGEQFNWAWGERTGGLLATVVGTSFLCQERVIRLMMVI